MKILISGAGGFIGSALWRYLAAQGHELTALSRTPQRLPEGYAGLAWHPPDSAPARAALESFDAVVHLAGENTAGGRWTPARRKRIYESRVAGTRLLSEQLAQLERPPVWVCASAVGWYGSRGDEVLTEASAPGTGFLARVCADWEAAAGPLAARGVRTVSLRFGAVLGRGGGLLGTLLPVYRFGAGGVPGSGRHWLSWVALDDAVRAIDGALRNPALSGPVNVTAPVPVPFKTFSGAVAEAAHRPAWLPLPAPLLRAVLGAMADELLLSSQRVLPQRLLDAGFEFRYPQLSGSTVKKIIGNEGRS